MVIVNQLSQPIFTNSRILGCFLNRQTQLLPYRNSFTNTLQIILHSLKSSKYIFFTYNYSTFRITEARKIASKLAPTIETFEGHRNSPKIVFLNFNHNSGKLPFWFGTSGKITWRWTGTCLPRQRYASPISLGACQSIDLSTIRTIQPDRTSMQIPDQ